MTDIPSEIGKYRILNEIGSGNYGTVYKAHDRAIDQVKAIKILNEIKDPQDFKEKLEEAHALGKFKGRKHIVQINSADVYSMSGSNRLIIDMEYISGGSFESRLKTGQLSFKSSVQYITHVLHALEYIHRSRMLHQDVKPANILIDGNIAKLSDFGLASLLGDMPTGIAEEFYRPHAAPETQNDGVTSIQTDIFATGMTLYRAVCHYKKWREQIQGIPDFLDIVAEGRIIEKIGYPSFVPSKLKKIIGKSCDADANKRYLTASEMISDLSRLNFNIDWSMKSPEIWTGVDLQKKQYDVEIVKEGKFYHVNVLKNGRRISDKCKKFPEVDAAYGHLNKYVSTTTFMRR